MAKKSIGFTELVWECPNCKTINPGSIKSCQACGTPQPDDVKFFQAANSALITDAEVLADIPRGADIHCPYCGTRNRSDAAVCHKCGGDLQEGIQRKAGRVIGKFKEPGSEPEMIPCANCGEDNLAGSSFCTQCGSPLGLAQPEPEMPQMTTPPQTAAQKKKRWVPLAAIFLSVLCIGMIIVVILAGSKKEDLSATVADLQWTLALEVAEEQLVSREGWYEDLPDGAQEITCEEKLHHTQADPAPGAVEVCGEPYTVDEGTGYAEVVQDCEYQVYKDFCDYQVLDWVLIARPERQGSGMEPVWPDVSLETQQQIVNEIENYVVIFETDDGKTYRYETKDLGEFQQFPLGSEWMLEVNLLGGINNIESK